MANVKKAILRALIEGVLTDLMVKTNVENVYLTDGTTTLAAKLSEVITSLNAKATPADVTAAVQALRAELMGEGVPEAYDTFKELADYVAAHEDVAAALEAAIGNKADKSALNAIQTTVNGLGALAKVSKVTESHLDDALKAKIDNAAAANHSHSNKSVLDGITQDKVNSWDAKGRFLASASQPADLAVGDLWAQIID